MNYMLKQFYLVLLILHNYRIKANLEEGLQKTCLLRNNEIGICKSFRSCHSAIEDARNGIRPVVCKNEEKSALVCCDEHGQLNTDDRRNQHRKVKNEFIDSPSVLELSQDEHFPTERIAEFVTGRTKHSIDPVAGVSDNRRETDGPFNNEKYHKLKGKHSIEEYNDKINAETTQAYHVVSSGSKISNFDDSQRDERRYYWASDYENIPRESTTRRTNIRTPQSDYRKPQSYSKISSDVSNSYSSQIDNVQRPQGNLYPHRPEFHHSTEIKPVQKVRPVNGYDQQKLKHDGDDEFRPNYHEVVTQRQSLKFTTASSLIRPISSQDLFNYKPKPENGKRVHIKTIAEQELPNFRPKPDISKSISTKPMYTNNHHSLGYRPDKENPTASSALEPYDSKLKPGSERDTSKPGYGYDHHTLRPQQESSSLENFVPDPLHPQRPRPVSEIPKPIVGAFSEYPNKPSINRQPPRRPQEKLRISEIKCREYSQDVRETIAGLPLTADPKPVEIEINKCNYNAQTLIVGGQNATTGEFPHMAALGFLDRNTRTVDWGCGGTLISENFVLTAAHCLVTSRGVPTFVRVGELNMKRTDDGAHPVDYIVKEAIKHPDYKPPIRYNDIALLRLARPVKFTKQIRPACLYHKSNFATNTTVATGWGRTDYGKETSDILLKVLMNIIDNRKCNHLYRSDTNSEALGRGIIDSQMCAGDLTGGKDTCKGDSGGPIEVTSRGNQCIHHVIGVTSFGKWCGLPDAPGVYTRVSSYVPWIEGHVWPQMHSTHSLQ